MDDGDRTALRLAPLWVFSAVSGHQSRFAAHELDSFWEVLQRVGAGTDGLALDVLAEVVNRRPTIFAEFEAAGLSIVSGLWKVSAVLTRLQQNDFRFVLMQLGFGLARARGPYGRTISIDDSQTLSLLAEMLEIDRAATDLAALAG